jgi:hypothetical protein
MLGALDVQRDQLICQKLQLQFHARKFHVAAVRRICTRHSILRTTGIRAANSQVEVLQRHANP